MTFCLGAFHECCYCCVNKSNSYFSFPPGSLSGAYCSFPSCSLCLCIWWNGGTRPSSSFQGWRKTHLKVLFDVCEAAAAFLVRRLSDWEVSSGRMTRSSSDWYGLITLLLLWFENTRWLAFKRIESVKLKQTSPHYLWQPRSHRKRKQWKFNFLTIRTSPP